MEINKGTLRTVYQRRDQFSVFIVIIYVTIFNYLNPLGTHILFNGIKILFYPSNFIRF